MFVVHSIFALLILSLGLRMALRLTYGARGPQPDDTLHLALTILSWVLIVCAVGPGLILITGWFGIIVLVLAVIAGIETLLAAYALARQTNLRMLDLAIERELPIGPALLESTGGHSRLIGHATEQLAADLKLGVPLLTAFEQNRRAVPRSAIAYAAAGEAVGNPAIALHEAARADDEMGGESIRDMLVDRIIYLLVIVGIMVGILTFIMIWIVPSFEKMFCEFGIELPTATVALIAVASWFVDYFGLFLLLAVLTLLVIVVIILVNKPVLHRLAAWLFRWRHRGLVLRALALAAEHKRPMAVMLGRMANHCPNRWIAQRIRHAADAVIGGAPWQEALTSSGLLHRADQAVLLSAQRAGNLPWALRTMADRQERRSVHRWFALVQIVYPICILLLAATVGFVVYSLFIPLLVLIESMAG